MNDKIILLHFDLRKYGHIEKNYDLKSIQMILQKYHIIISTKLLPFYANIYQIHTDTALYEINNQINLYELIQTLSELKEQVIQELKGYSEEINLGINCVYNEGMKFDININGFTKKNVCGKVMNDLQKMIDFIDQSNDKALINGIVISEEFYNEVKNRIVMKSYHDTNYYIR